MTTTRGQYRTPHHVSTQPGIHPDDQPEMTGEDMPPVASQKKQAIPHGIATPLRMPDLPARQDAPATQQIMDDTEQEDTDTGYGGYTTRLPTSTLRYTRSEQEQALTSATPRTLIRVTHHAVPPRAHAGQERRQPSRQAPTQHAASARPHTVKPLPGRQRTRTHTARSVRGSTWFGAGAAAFVGGLLGIQLLVAPWWNGVQDNWHYGTPRTVQMDAIVGGGDSVTHPTHFIATNVAGHPSVMEMHASDPDRTNMIVVPMTTDPRFPVILEVKDVNHDRQPDLLVTVNGTRYAYLNDGHGTFRPLKYGEKIDVS